MVISQSLNVKVSWKIEGKGTFVVVVVLRAFLNGDAFYKACSGELEKVRETEID